MPQSPLSLDWINQFSDPYAVLGISVTADDRRVQKRYRKVAMVLHPDKYALQETVLKQSAETMLAKLVNPAYEKLSQEKERKEHIALLRIQVRKLIRQGPLNPTSELARQLLQYPASEVDVFYEQAVTQLAEVQYNPFSQSQFETITAQLSELNQVYLQLKMGDVPALREKRTGLVAAEQSHPIKVTPTPVSPEVATENYAQRHYRRAKEYMRQNNWSQAVQELRDAIKIEPNDSDFHALLGVAYLQQSITAMAKVHIRRALELKPDEPLALRYAAKLGIVPNNGQPSNKGQPSSKAETNEKKSNTQTRQSQSTTNNRQSQSTTNNRQSQSTTNNRQSQSTTDDQDTKGFTHSLLNFFRKLLRVLRLDKLFGNR